MRIILFGPPCSGKGTQAQFIMKKYGIPQISTGDMLRAAIKSNSTLSKKIRYIIDAGKLIADELIITMVKKRITQKDCYNGFLLDGFPRTISQANAIIDEGIKIDYILEFNVPDKILIERVVGRRIHITSGRIYHIKYNPPKIKDKDDVTGETLITRSDDQKDIIRKRLIEYHKNTIPLIDHYVKMTQTHGTKYIKIDGTKSVDDIYIILERTLV